MKKKIQKCLGQDNEALEGLEELSLSPSLGKHWERQAERENPTDLKLGGPGLWSEPPPFPSHINISKRKNFSKPQCL